MNDDFIDQIITLFDNFQVGNDLPKPANLTESELIGYLSNRLDKRTKERTYFENHFENSPDAIFIHDFTKITHVNTAFLELFEFEKKEDIIGLPAIESTVFPEDYQKVHAIRERLKDEKKIFFKDIRCIKKSGEVFSTEAYATLIMIDGVPHLEIISRDISERKILEKKNKESEAKYREIVDSLVDVLIRVNGDGIVEMISPSIVSLGYNPDEILGKPVLNFYVSQEDRAAYLKEIKENGVCRFFETEVYSKTGEIIVISSHGKLYKDSNGKYGIESVFRDITKYKKQQNELIENELKLRRFIEMAPIGIAINDMDGAFIEANQEFLRFTGYGIKELVELSYWELTPEKYADKEQAQLDLLNEFNAYGPYEKEYIHRDGHLYPVLLYGIKIKDEKGDDVIWSVIQDITVQKEGQKIKEEFTRNLEIKVKERTKDLETARKELALSLEKEKELGDLKSRFVSTASHQFRTPLTVIKANVGIMDMLKDNIHEEFRSKFERIYARINNQIVRMTSLMDDVLILGKINSGNVELVAEPIDLIRLCENIIAVYNEIQKDGRTMKIEVLGDDYMIPLDTKLIEHALSNLISNAFKYSIDEVNPLLKINFGNDEIDIVIEDHGMGIPVDEIDFVFEPFHRAANTHEIAGTGLGLAIAKEYIEMNGGTITVESELEVGTKFRVKFFKEYVPI